MGLVMHQLCDASVQHIVDQERCKSPPSLCRATVCMLTEMKVLLLERERERDREREREPERGRESGGERLGQKVGNMMRWLNRAKESINWT